MSATLPRTAVALILALSTAAIADEPYDELRDKAWTPDVPVAADAIADSDVLDLSWLIAEVHRRNPSVDVALNTWRAALARYPQARSLADPTVSYGVAPLSLDNPDLHSGHRFEVSQHFPWPGKRRLRGERALAEADARQLDVKTVREELAREAREAFYEYWYVHRALEINAVNAELLTEYLDLAESNYAAGATSRQDALQAEVEREHLGHDAIMLRRMLNVTRARINSLIREAPDTPLPPAPAALPVPAPLPDPVRLQALALEQRPELAALSAAIDADALGERLARKEFYPDFTVFGGYNSLWQEDDLRPILGASVNLPVRIGRRRAALDEARAERQRSEASLERERYRIAYDVQQAYELLVENAHVVRLYEDRLLSIAEANLEAAEADYYTVEGDFLTLITAQRQLMDTQLGAYEALATYHQSVAALERAVGVSLVEAVRESEVDDEDH